MYKGKVINNHVDSLGNNLFQIRYWDGDEEDLFLSELIKYVEVEN